MVEPRYEYDEISDQGARVTHLASFRIIGAWGHAEIRRVPDPGVTVCGLDTGTMRRPLDVGADAATFTPCGTCFPPDEPIDE